MVPSPRRPVRGHTGDPVGQALFRLLLDCPTCRVHGALVEVVRCVGSQVAQEEATCSLCGHRERAGRAVRDGVVPTSTAQALALLNMWAQREGEAPTHFAKRVFGQRDLAAVGALLLGRGEVPTLLDPLEWLAPETLVGDGGSPPVGPLHAPHRPPRYHPLPPRPPGADPLPPRRVTTHALVAVLAGGRPPRPTVRRFLDRALETVSRPPLEEGNLKPWRPTQLPCPEDPESLLAAMAELAEVERRRGPAPWSVVKDFARSWNVPLAPLEQRASDLRAAGGPGLVRLWYRLRALLADERG